MKSKLTVVRTSHPVPSRSAAEEDERRTTLWVDAQGQIVECDAGARAAFGFFPDELAGVHVSRLFPWLRDVRLMIGGEVNPRLAFRCRCGTVRLVDSDGADVVCQLFVNAVCLAGGPAVALIVAQPFRASYQARETARVAKRSPLPDGYAALAAGGRAATA